jgi:predicted Zn-dependent protease
MPFILEGFWLLYKLWFGAFVLLRAKQEKFSDPQLVALKYYGVGYQALTDKRWLDALEALTLALHQKTPSPETGHWLRGQTWLALGNPERCIQDCDEALRHCLYNSHVYYLKAQALYAQGELAAAQEMCHYALRLATANADVYALQARCQTELARAQGLPAVGRVQTVVQNT